jgi:hypothetical protein
VRRMWGRLDDSKMTSDPRLAYVGRKSRDRWNERTQPQIRRWNNSDYQMARGIFGVEEKIVGGMYRAGVPLLAGTDAMNPYCLPGFSLHDELALMVESGLSALAALQTATNNPAKRPPAESRWVALRLKVAGLRLKPPEGFPAESRLKARWAR